MRVAVLTKIPSPYQVELLDAVAAHSSIDLSVIYVRASDEDRSWSARPLRHDATFLDAHPDVARSVVERSELAVFGWYRDSPARRLIVERAATDRPWCFWGERPGFRHRGFAGRTYRRLALWPLWRNPRVAIWGIGEWAIEGYGREFGSARPYFHVPYASNLAPFLDIARTPAGSVQTILFSGSLIERKGIVELIAAFRNLSQRRPTARLRILGTGPLEAKLRAECARDAAIEFLGFRDWDALPRAYAEGDVLCAPSRYDGWGLIVPEAMAAGMPVVATDTVGSARELVEDGRTGWRVPPRDVRSLEGALQKALDLAPSALSEMRTLCRERARRYGVVPGATRFVEAAEKTLARWNAGRA